MNDFYINRLLKTAFEEDIPFEDVTTKAIINSFENRASGYLQAKQDGVLCGIDIFKKALKYFDEDMNFFEELSDGQNFCCNDILIKFKGKADAILKSERTALNFLQHLSGVATLTFSYVNLVKDLKVKVVDTRKTTPGLRILEKYAVKCGGGSNHRFSLSDMVLLKDNHIAYAGGIKKAVGLVKQDSSHTLKIEVEVSNIEQLKEALNSKVDIIMLDNMNIEEIREAVSFTGGKALLEASGNIDIENLRQIAQSGVDIISIGRLTHSAPNIDISLKFSIIDK